MREPWKQRDVESALLAEAREIARGLGRSRLELWAREDDRAFIAFLGRHGFREVMREGGNQEARALNLPLGYTPLPSSIAFHGPV